MRWLPNAGTILVTCTAYVDIALSVYKARGNVMWAILAMSGTTSLGRMGGIQAKEWL